MRAHLSRKKPCVVVEDGQDIDLSVLLADLGDMRSRKHNVMCDLCQSKFSCSASLSRHRKKCAQDKGNVNSDVNIDIENIVERKVQEALAKLQLGHNTNIQGDQYNIVNIHAYGNENMNYITPEFLTQCVKSTAYDGIPRFIENIHINPEHPENQNIRGRSIRQNMLEVFDGKSWKLNHAGTVLDKLMQKGCKIFYNHLMRGMDESEDLQMVLEKQLIDLADVTKKRKSETYYKIRRNLFFMFFQDKPDDLVLVMDPEGQNIVEPMLDSIDQESFEI